MKLLYFKWLIINFNDIDEIVYLILPLYIYQELLYKLKQVECVQIYQFLRITHWYQNFIHDISLIQADHPHQN